MRKDYEVESYLVVALSQVIIILKLVAGLRCQGCGACHRLVSKKSHLCLYCMGFRLDAERIKNNLDRTVSRRYAAS